MNKRLGFLIGIIVVAVVVIVATRGLQPKEGVKGTIGAASRYQSEQITGADVALNDPEIQAFIQTDLFQKMRTNEEFRKLVTDASARQVMARAEYGRIISDPRYRDLSLLPEFHQIASSADFGKCMESGLLPAVFANADFAKMLTKPEASWMARPEVSKLPAAEFTRILACNECLPVLRMPEYQKFAAMVMDKKVTTVAEMNKLAVASFPDLAKLPDFNKLMNVQGYADLAVRPEYLQIIMLPHFMEMSKLPEMSKFVQVADVLWARPEFAQLITSPGFLNLLPRAEFAAVVTNPDFKVLAVMPSYQQIAGKQVFWDMNRLPEYSQVVNQATFQKLAVTGVLEKVCATTMD